MVGQRGRGTLRTRLRAEEGCTYLGQEGIAQQREHKVQMREAGWSRQLQPRLQQTALSSPLCMWKSISEDVEATCLGLHCQNSLGFTHLTPGLLQGATYCSKGEPLP